MKAVLIINYSQRCLQQDSVAAKKYSMRILGWGGGVYVKHIVDGFLFHIAKQQHFLNKNQNIRGVRPIRQKGVGRKKENRTTLR